MSVRALQYVKPEGGGLHSGLPSWLCWSLAILVLAVAVVILVHLAREDGDD